MTARSRRAYPPFHTPAEPSFANRADFKSSGIIHCCSCPPLGEEDHEGHPAILIDTLNAALVLDMMALRYDSEGFAQRQWLRPKNY